MSRTIAGVLKITTESHTSRACMVSVPVEFRFRAVGVHDPVVLVVGDSRVVPL